MLELLKDQIVMSRKIKDNDASCILQKKMHKIITIGLINGVVKWLKSLPSTNEISKTMSPATIVQGLPKSNVKFKIIVLVLFTITRTGKNNKMYTRSEPDIELNS